MRIVGLIGILFFLFSCTEQVVEEISMEELIPQSSYDKNSSTKVKDTVVSAPIELNYLDSIVHLNYPFIQTVSVQNSHSEFIDRMNFEEKNESKLVLDSISLILTSWTYADSIQTENAFFNWIDCWGDDCLSFRIGETAKLQKDAVSIWVGEHNIVYANSTENYDFEFLQKIVFDAYGDEWKYVFNKKVSRRINWLVSPLEQ